MCCDHRLSPACHVSCPQVKFEQTYQRCHGLWHGGLAEWYAACLPRLLSRIHVQQIFAPFRPMLQSATHAHRNVDAKSSNRDRDRGLVMSGVHRVMYKQPSRNVQKPIFMFNQSVVCRAFTVLEVSCASSSGKPGPLNTECDRTLSNGLCTHTGNWSE